MAGIYQRRGVTLHPVVVTDDNNVPDESAIGIWFGKTLYRRRIPNLVFPQLSTNGVQIFNLGLTEITVTRFECVSTLTDGRSFILPYYDSTACHLYVKNGKIIAYGSGTLFKGATNQLTIEYIKL